MRRLHGVMSAIGRRLGKPIGYERLVRAVAAPETCRMMSDVLLTFDEFAFMAQPSVPIGWHLFFFGNYEAEEREVFRSVLRSGSVALDVGANVGWHSVLMAHLVGQTGRVLAFEPNPSVCDRLRKNIDLNRQKQVEIYPLALSNTRRDLRFLSPSSNAPDSGDGHVLPSETGRNGEVITVKASTLDSIVEAAKLDRLDLIKIDVEGFEWPVLQGAERTLSRFRPHVVFEYIEEYLDRGGGTREMIDNYLRCRGYDIFAISRYGNECMSGRDWPSGNLWAVPTS